ncbi:conjugal transfer protein TraN [Escherichia coli]|nr:conjugal transfer protein TraN [Escherichia coli]EFA9863061.1 conjugal transfer protein TraN [Escherichia coli]EKM6558381.1 conjugal transfer protein TraN [Escherichia coli]ELG5359315.1 conjugal transfer protein TraN [Escherichia coli]
MGIIKSIVSYLLIITQLVMLIGIMPVRAENPIAPNFVCGQDLNTNGYLGDEGEYTACRTATLNHSANATPYCLAGYTMQSNGMCIKYEYAPLGSQCPSGYFIQNGQCMKEEYLQAQAYCPSGYIVVGNGCQKVTYTNPTQSCPAGSVIQNGRCISQSQTTPTASCPSGTNSTTFAGSPACSFYNTSAAPSGYPILACQGVSQVPGLAVCFVSPRYICNQGSLVNGRCIVSVDKGAVQLTCPSGSQLINGQCKKTESTNLNYLCQTGTLINNQCKVVTNGGPVKAVCNPGYIVQNGQCVKSTQASPQYSCSQGALSGNKCVWDTQENYCPIGLNQSCLNNNGGASCSPNKCVDISVNKPVDEGNVDGSMLVDDGKKNEDGVCMDQLFIFSGRGQDCKLAGIDTAYKNCCKSEGKVFTDSVGAMGSLSTTASTVSKLYTAAQEAYTYYTVAMQATGDAAIASSMAAQGFSQALVAMFNPATIAIAVAMYFVMEYLMKACDQTSMETAMAADSGYCHEIGTYCKKKIPLLGCVQKATSYCCFNSKLARIIHEQGRPQLKNFNGWGDASSPQCRGFSPEEFQALDFSKIDLSEYVEDMVKKATDEIQSNVNQITQDFYEKTN